MRLIPKQPRSIVAALLAIAVHVALALFLLFGVRWQNKSGEAMLVEVVPPPPVTKSVPPPQPVAKPPPEPPPPAPPPPGSANRHVRRRRPSRPNPNRSPSRTWRKWTSP
ncbi:MAG: hypothetical protein IPI73_02825 [Betaproteobacteria bacterium]|nr:hypothetical protein [Betaproteobacteria bacterium]